MPAVDFLQLALEEFPNNEQTYSSSTTPNRKSTDLLYPAIREARIDSGPIPMSRGDEMRGILGEVPRLADNYEPNGSLTARAYGDLLPWFLSLAGFQGTVTPGGATVTDANQTTVTGINALNSATVNVADTSLFPSSGTFILAGTTAVSYTGKTATSFTGCGSHPATTGGELVNGNVPTGANKWVFLKKTGFNPQTARIRANYADENVLVEGYGFAFSSLSLNAAAELSADLAGLFVRRLAADSSTVPAVQSETVQPFRRGDLYISALAGGGVLSDFTINIANSLERVHSGNLLPPSDYPDTLEFGDDQVLVTGTLPKRILTGTDYDALTAATTFSMQARWQGRTNIAATSKPYGLWIDMPKVQYVGGQTDPLSNRRRHGFTPDWFAGWDSSAGYDCKITVVNGVTSIATYV